MKKVYIVIAETGERIAIEKPVWVTCNRNGLLRTPHRVKALGVSDGETIWSLDGLDGHPQARIITRAEYEERPGEAEADPELSAEEALALIMEGSYETE